MNNRVLSFEEEKEYEMLKKIHNSRKLHIVNETGDQDSRGFPENIVVCSPAGLDQFAVYTISDSSHGGWD